VAGRAHLGKPDGITCTLEMEAEFAKLREATDVKIMSLQAAVERLEQRQVAPIIRGTIIPLAREV
jgi:hypothetical protein